ncbi:2-amino-4-hydroxy-6-hydroxymethyldihydropteridine diphosphokinase [Limnohabitans sp. G3-2]|uniref:2-amino-4-hydroxy-6- hydroxymethyldihydropteridine diphosphokinase n=1 Tax=Limnohabitans sp. G3-2 TaxID=1100711 RepID=UPI000C1F652E|nr:2-amino-4-hydroxy-6-hydroxymethyldihydropteridine diphosphokinase [Limnohabitans sp. G3-2]PIT72702.1 2-amino-4-hydroxy-6-hydroxymethyldihydropteridine diphosphokinase [Limnohabitans sp. G3-2]
MRDPVTACVALGANLGDARAAVLQAFEALASWPGMELTGRSVLYRTAPHEAQGPDFINAVARIDTRLTAPDVLNALQAIEHQAGRLRPYVNAPRSLDLDLLFYGDACMHSPRLTLPHPRWRERAFVLYPLADVWPQRVLPEDMARVVGQVIERDGAAHT